MEFDVNKYFDDLMDKIDALTDEEFDQLLIESGIEKCDEEDATTSI
jgi:hypothetical protein